MRKAKFFLKYNLIFFSLALLILFLFIQQFDLYSEVGLKKIALSPKFFYLSLISICLGLLIFFVDKRLTKFSASRAHSYPFSSTFRGMMDILRFEDLLKNFSSYNFLCGSILASFYEEILFRGLGIFLLVRYLHINSAVSLVLAALLFGVYHIFLSRMAILSKFVAGLFFGYLYIVTDHIYYPILAHLIWNMFIWKTWRNAYRNFLKGKAYIQIQANRYGHVVKNEFIR